LVERRVDLERHALGVYQVLEGETDVERDHRAGQVSGVEREIDSAALVLGTESLGYGRPDAAPETRRQLAEAVIAHRQRETLEPEADEPIAAPLRAGVALDKLLGAPAELLAGRQVLRGALE